jgi:hypothetical protein
MPVVMVGQGHDRIPGPEQHAAAEGWEDHAADAVAGPRPGTALAVRPRETVVVPGDSGLVVTPEHLADLHDPSLIISGGYVGPDRRRFDRADPPAPPVPEWLHRILVVVFLTALVVTPLTLIAARSVPPAATSPNAAPGSTTPRSAKLRGAGDPTPHVFTASSQEVARADAAYQRALARAEGPVAAAPAGPSVAAAPAAPQGVPGAQAQLQSAPSTAAVQRAADQSQAAQARAANQAAAAQRRAAAAAARAQARAQRTGAHGGGSGSDGSPATTVPVSG